jgi:hypothetical protein
MWNARVIRIAPNGDIFLSRSRPEGKVMVIRAKPGADKPDSVETFASSRTLRHRPLSARP